MQNPPVKVEIVNNDPDHIRDVAQRIVDSLFELNWEGDIEMVTLFGSLLKQCGADMRKPENRDKVKEVRQEGIYRAWFDGSSKGNPGPAQIGYVIIDDQGTMISRRAEPIGTNTNNVAEYMALKELVSTLKMLGVKNVHIQGDSKLVVEQINGNWKVKNDTLKEIHRQIKEMLKEIPNFKIEWVPRDKNSMADNLAQNG